MAAAGDRCQHRGVVGDRFRAAVAAWAAGGDDAATVALEGLMASL